ncbi:hypothetical protein BSL82_10415 [Tardibacter chloracetimidivorans]|uniref:NmrA-like domain-containing protein n=2 Tax=Tardibacter chloracetimidivorans TaxID=1921510 RepID=A0A1L3ZVR1_9SPHN|nr:hypothetical protein BSL82_10415 [Tardibacter chloracetimidivorans]
MDTILIIGGSGTVGGHLLTEIARQGLDRRLNILCAARSEATARNIEAQGFAAVHVDLDEPQSITAAMDGVTTLFLLKPYGLKMLNYAKSVVDAAAAASVRAIVNLSAFGPDASAIDLLTWHRLVDRYIESSDIAFTHLRPGFFLEGLAARINLQLGTVGDLSGARDVPWVAATDIARVAATVLGVPGPHAGKAYSLVSEALSAPYIARLLGEVAGRAFTEVAIEDGTAVEALISRGREPGFARAIVEYAKAAPDFPCDDATGTIETITGHSAISVREFLERNLAAKESSAPT